MQNENKCSKYIKPDNKILKILILGGGPIGLFIGYKLLKNGNEITIFEKRKKYIRHNILSLQETTKLDTLSLIPSEIMEELNNHSSFSNINANIKIKNNKCCKNILKEKPYLMASSNIYYIVLNELETAYEKYFKTYGGKIIKPEKDEIFKNIKIDNNYLLYTENNIIHTIDLIPFDIIIINDGANSYFRNIYFEKTSYTEHIENNIIRYGLDDKYNDIKISNDISDIQPFAHGLLLIYNIDNNQEFHEKFKIESKLKEKTDFDSILELESKNNNFMNGLTIKEILIKNNSDKNNIPNHNINISQNLFRMFVSEKYLYISIMINPKDTGDYLQKIQNQKIIFSNLPENIQLYIKFVLYYYDLNELIDLHSNNLTIKMFPLTFGYVKQSCTFIKKNNQSVNESDKEDMNYCVLEKKDSYFGTSINEIISKELKWDNEFLSKNNYQFIMLCGDAMASGNFHTGIVLNRNLVAVNNICQLIDEYIDAYPKDKDGNLNNNFLRLLFFHVNIINQKARNEIITKSLEALINFGKLDNDDSIFNLQQILSEFNEIILCKNCSSKNKLMCKNSIPFIKFIVDNSSNEILQRILKYLLLPNKYKYTDFLEHLNKIEPPDLVFS